MTAPFGSNPFESPQAPYAPTPTAAAGRLEVGAAVSSGFDALTKYAGPWIGIIVLQFVLGYIAGLTVIGSFIIPPVLQWGATLFALKTIDGGARFDDLWAGFQRFGEAWVGIFVSQILAFLAVLPGAVLLIISGVMTFATVIAADELTPRVWMFMGFGALVFLAWTLVITPRLMFSALFVVDRRLGPVEALRASWDLTSGQTANAIVLLCVSGVILIVGALLLGVGIIPAFAVMSSAYAAAYRQLVPREHDAGAFV